MENSVYISEFLTPNLKSFPCILKARYSDFHVTEILPDGTIAKIVSPLPSDAVPMSDDSEDPALTSIESSTAPLAENIVEDDQVEALPPNEVAPKCSISSPVADEPTSDDDWKSKEPWVSLFLADPESIEKLNEFVVSVHSLLSSSESKVIESYPIANKEKRTLIHQYLKHESISKSGFVLYSSTIPETNVITVTRRRLTREKTHAASQSSDACFERPKFVQFYLYKQNRSTMETIGKMAYFLRKPAKHFSFAGTKDKRAVTIQRVVINNQGANRISLQRLLSLNKILRSFGMWVSDVKPAADQLLLGTDLWGNRFSIFLRDLSISSGEEIEGNILALKNAGFINYYGAQRFGTVGDFMTHLVGIEILKENWPEVIRLIMAPRPPGQEKEEIENARKLWAQSPTVETASMVIASLPHSMLPEKCLMSFFSKQSSVSDCLGAIHSIPHEMKMMYVHAVQSLIWNFMATERILLGRGLMVGDLVMDHNSSVLMLESEEQLSKYGLEHVVLPLPGNSIKYPSISGLMGKLELFIATLFNNSTNISNFGENCKMGRLAGAYRKLVSKPVDLSYNFVEYSSSEETVIAPMLENKLNVIEEPQAGDAPEGEQEKDHQLNKKQKCSFLGLKLEFSLPSSCYATMALREITRADTSSSAQKMLSHR